MTDSHVPSFEMRRSPPSSTLKLRPKTPGYRAVLLTTVLTLLAIPAVPAVESAVRDDPAILNSHAVEADAPARLGYRPQRGMFLVAGPRLPDPRFAHTVILLLEYGETGALGLVINRPTQLSLHDALVNPLPKSAGHVVFSGGPVEHQRLIALLRSPAAVEGAEHVFGDVYASGSMDTLRRMLERDEHAADVHTYVGYAGWSPGQLDAEIARGDWIVTPADATSIFDTPSGDVWRDLMRRNSGRWVRAGPADSASGPADLALGPADLALGLADSDAPADSAPGLADSNAGLPDSA